MELRMGISNYTAESGVLEEFGAELGDPPQHECQTQLAVIPDMELECVLEEDKCIRHVSED